MSIMLGLGKDAFMREYVDEFRDYAKSGGKENKRTKPLKETFVTMAVSSAECERRFGVSECYMYTHQATSLSSTGPSF